MLESIQPFAIALLIGLCAGIERERSHNGSDNAMGMRTFVLIALLGSSAAFIDQAAVTLGIIFFLTVLVGLGYWRSTQNANISIDAGLTTEIAGGGVFLLGFLAKSAPLLASSLGVSLVAVLYFRKRLHTFALDVLRPQEIMTAILLAAFSLVIIPFLPNRAIDPWELINPRQLAQVVALIAALEFCGYIAERLAGAKIGMLATGLLGGLASSTATFLNLSRTARKNPEKTQIIVGASLLAVVSPLLLFIIIVYASSPALIPLLGIPVLVACAVAGLLGVVIGRGGTLTSEDRGQLRNPLDLPAVVKLAVLLSSLLIIATLTQRHFGTVGIDAVSFIGGLFELHGVTLANSTLHAKGALKNETAVSSLFMAIAASFVSKIGICWILAPGRFAVIMTVVLTAVVIAGSLTIKWF